MKKGAKHRMLMLPLLLVGDPVRVGASVVRHIAPFCDLPDDGHLKRHCRTRRLLARDIHEGGRSCEMSFSGG